MMTYTLMSSFMCGMGVISMALLNQEHLTMSFFISVSECFEPFNMLMSAISWWVGSMMLLSGFKYINSSDTKVSGSPTLYIVMVLMVVTTSVCFFCTNNIAILYICFELSMFPTLVLITKWGYQPERLKASFYFAMYTITASLPLLFFLLNYFHFMMTTEIPPSGFTSVYFSSPSSSMMICGMIAFLVKSPMWGTHLWLPKAHVEAPVSGSMVLAGILLKLGGYGLMKMSLFMNFPNLLFTSLSLWGLLTVSLVCTTQVDMKSMIAYSSVIHMGLMLLGIMSNSTLGHLGAMMMMIIHGVNSPGMFAAANMNYEMSSSRSTVLQKGLHTTQPVTSLVWFVLVACNAAAPPFMSLAAEILIISSILKTGMIVSLLLASAVFLSLCYNLILYSYQQGAFSLVLNTFNGLRMSTMMIMFFHITLMSASLFTMYLFKV